MVDAPHFSLMQINLSLTNLNIESGNGTFRDTVLYDNPLVKSYKVSLNNTSSRPAAGPRNNLLTFRHI